ncbi:hypothetical protein T06_4999 [Trichinella sp. T6]|nr:hypothetical protein T06_4999 [Trichinella sp. T6]
MMILTKAMKFEQFSENGQIERFKLKTLRMERFHSKTALKYRFKSNTSKNEQI